MNIVEKLRLMQTDHIPESECMTTVTDDLKPGDRATWMRAQRGGYGYVVPVPCTIEQVPEGGGRVRIRVVKADGDIVYRHVAPESLRAVRR